MESPNPKPYSFQWFLQEIVRAVFVAASMLVLSVAAMGILQAYLLPERMDKESAIIQKRFDAEIATIRATAISRREDAIKRESELIAQLEAMKKLYLEGLVMMRKGSLSAKDLDDFDNKLAGEIKAIDPERSRREWIERYSK